MLRLASPSLVVAVTAVVIPAAAGVDNGTVIGLWNCDSAAGLEGLETETTNVKQGKAAIRWRDHPQTPGFGVPDVPRDWTKYNLLRLWIHSAKSVPASFMIIIGSENPATEGADYWSYKVGLGFTGWKELVLPIGQRTGSRSPRGWDQIDGVTFTAAGWGNTPHPEADVLIDDMRLDYEPPRPGPRMTDDEFFDNLDLSRDDLAKVRAAVAAGDLGKAKAAFLDHLRSRRTPRWWFDWRDRPTRAKPLTGGSEGWDYYATGINVDWTGWKEFDLPLKDWGAARKPIGWHHVNYLSFSATYGDRTPNPKTTLVFDDLRLIGAKPVDLGTFEEQADLERWPQLHPTGQHVKSGERAGMWSQMRTNTSIRATDIPHDWTGFESLRFWAYSAEATGDHLTLIADSDTPNVSSAEAICNHMHGGHFLGDDIDWESNKYDPKDPAFTKEWTYGLNRFRDWQTLGRAYWQTGDEKYAKEWIAQMRDWVEDNPYLLYGTGNNTLTWRTIEAGIRTAGAWPDSLYYFLGSPSLQPDDLVTFMKSWIEHAHHLMRITVEHPEHGGNWVTMECNGLGHLGILLPECEDAPTWLKTAADRMTMELERQVYPDGAQKELTTGYHQVARNNFVGLHKIALHNGVALPKEYLQRLERMYDYNLRCMTPEGKLPPLNDAGYTNVIPSLREGAELFGRDDFQWAATGGVEGTAPDYTSVAFPYAGQYVMRSGWERDGRYLLFESGPFGIGHQHEDKLSMFIYALGRVLLTEAGTYSYDASKYRRYVLGTWAHNTILVDGRQQHRRDVRATYETEEPLDNLWLHNEVFDAADGVYESGYGPGRDVDVKHERTVVFVRPDYWVVVDRLLAEGEHTYDILWHLNSEAAERDPKTLAAWGTGEGVANLMVTPASAAGLSLDVVVGRDEPVLGFAPMARKQPIPVLNYKLRANGPVTLAWVLTPFAGNRPPVSTEMELGEAGTTVSVMRGDTTDHVFVAKRGTTPAVSLGGADLKGTAAVVRTGSGRVVSSRAE